MPPRKTRAKIITEKYLKKVDSWEIIDIRTPLWEVPEQQKLRYAVSWTTESENIILDKIENKLTLKQEMFCQAYCINEETRFNWTRSYAMAYWYDIDWASTEEIRDQLTGDILKKSERRRIENICWVASKAILSNLKIQSRITQLFNELKRDDIVDREMMKLILQWADNRAKQDMIKEYNKLQQRILDRQKDESESDKAKAELYKWMAEKVKTMNTDQINQTLQDLLTGK